MRQSELISMWLDKTLEKPARASSMLAVPLTWVYYPDIVSRRDVNPVGCAVMGVHGDCVFLPMGGGPRGQGASHRDMVSEMCRDRGLSCRALVASSNKYPVFRSLVAARAFGGPAEDVHTNTALNCVEAGGKYSPNSCFRQHLYLCRVLGVDPVWTTVDDLIIVARAYRDLLIR